MAFNLYVAPRPHYPALYVQSFFMPFELSWGMPNPDFLNHNGFIDGARTYRIQGNRHGNRWTTLQLFRGFCGDDVQGTLGTVDFDDLPATADGSFGIFLGPSPPADTRGAYWVKLDPAVTTGCSPCARPFSTGPRRCRWTCISRCSTGKAQRHHVRRR